MLRSIVVSLVLLLVPLEAHAQFVVESSTPTAGAAGVATTATVRFTFSDDVSTKTNWNTAFVAEPQDAVEIQQANLLLDDGGQTAVVEYEVEHAPDTDVTWLVYAVEKEDESEASRWVEPYVLRYTTAASVGSHHVNGAVRASVASLASPAAKRRAISTTGPSRSTWARLVRMATEGGLGMPVFDAPSGDGAKQVASASNDDPPDVTSVFLLERFTTSEREWAVRGGTVFEGRAGAYEIAHVRDGTYWPLAVRYADRARTEIEALGFYDADGDGAPDPIAVSGGNTSGIDLQLYSFPLTTARSYAAEASAAADRYAPDQRLVYVESGHGVRPAGTAYVWTYHFYAPSEDRETVVTVTPLGVDVSMRAEPGFVREMPALPGTFLDSDAALQAALEDGGRDFVNRYGPRTLSTHVEGGRLYWLEAGPTRAFWRVRVLASTRGGGASFERFVDMGTGDILRRLDAAALQLAPNYPNPFREQTTLEFTLPESAAVRLVVYDVRGRRVRTLVDREVGAGVHAVRWDGRNEAGQPVASGVYLGRLDVGNRQRVQRIVRVR